MSLEQILEQIDSAKATMALVDQEIDPRVRAGVEANARNAAEEIGKLEQQYQNAVMSNLMVFTVSGKYSKEFAATAANLGLLSVNYEGVVEKLAERLEARNAPVPFDSNTNFMLLDELAKLRIEYNILQLPTPTANMATDCVYGEDLRTALKNLFRKNYGEGLFSAIVRRELGKQAYDLKFKGKKIGVVIYNNNGTVDTSMLANPTAVFEANEVPDEAQIKKELMAINKVANKKQ